MRRRRGFTLPELLACLAILAVLLAVAMPALATFHRAASALSAMHLLSASLGSARIAAVTRGVPVSVCPSVDGMACRLDLVWDAGWIVFVDADRSGQPSSPAAVLAHVQNSAGIAIRATIGRHRIRFQPNGFASGANVSLRLCWRAPADSIGMVVVNQGGRPRSVRDAARTPCAFSP